MPAAAFLTQAWAHSPIEQSRAAGDLLAQFVTALTQLLANSSFVEIQKASELPLGPTNEKSVGQLVLPLTGRHSVPS